MPPRAHHRPWRAWPAPAPPPSSPAVATSESHLQELMLEHAVPPPAPPGSSSVSLVRMGFPSRNPEAPGAAAFTGAAAVGCGGLICLGACLGACWRRPLSRRGGCGSGPAASSCLHPLHRPRRRHPLQHPSQQWWHVAWVGLLSAAALLPRRARGQQGGGGGGGGDGGGGTAAVAGRFLAHLRRLPAGARAHAGDALQHGCWAALRALAAVSAGDAAGCGQRLAQTDLERSECNKDQRSIPGGRGGLLRMRRRRRHQRRRLQPARQPVLRPNAPNSCKLRHSGK